MINATRRIRNCAEYATAVKTAEANTSIIVTDRFLIGSCPYKNVSRGY